MGVLSNITFGHMWMGVLWWNSGIMHSGILPYFSRYYSSLTVSVMGMAMNWSEGPCTEKVEQGQNLSII